MRSIGWWILSVGLFVQNPGAWLGAQDTPRQAVENVIDPDDQEEQKEQFERRVQELQKRKAELQRAIQEKKEGFKKKGPPKGPPMMKRAESEVERTVDRLMRELEELRREMKKPKGGPPFRPEAKRGFKPGGFGPYKMGMGMRFGPPMHAMGGVEHKLDRILDEMAQMRRDIKEVQERLPPGKGKGPGFQFEFELREKGQMKKKGGPGGPGGFPGRPGGPGRFAPEKKAPRDAENDEQQERPDRSRQQGTGEAQAMHAQMQQMQKQIQRLLEEVERLHGELRKAKAR